MKNRKTSYSLSKLNIKKTDLHQNSQRSFKKKHSRRANHSQIERIDLHTPLQSEHHQAVLNQYYGTNQKLLTQQDQIDLLQNTKRIPLDKITHDIESKMRRVIQNHQFDSQINLGNIVIEQSDVDQQFQDKINQNKHLLKQQREKLKFTSPQHKIQHQIQQLNQKKLSKKLSLLKNYQKIQRKHKTKSLLPIINSHSSKALNIVQQKLDKNRQKNLSQRQFLKLQNISTSPPNHLQTFIGEEYNPVEHKKSLQAKHVVLPNNSIDPRKDQKFKRKFTDLNIKKQDKKVAQLKLQSKIQQLKNKIAQRTSDKQTKIRVNNQNQNLPNQKKHGRYSSHSVFDNIQDFLSNPHENNSKSQRKFLKLYEKLGVDSHSLQKQKQQIQNKIKKIQQKIINYEKSFKEEVIQQDSKQKPQRPTSTSTSPLNQLDSQFGALQWRRLQRQNIQKSSFENELKYVKSLQQKGYDNLMKYIQNQKILHELKVMKRTQQPMSKVMHKDNPNLKLQKYTSL